MALDIAQDEPGFTTGRIDLAYLDAVRARIPVAQHRVL